MVEHTHIPDLFFDAKIGMVRTSVKEILPSIRSAKPMPQLKILCGKNGGLPFDYLMTDILSGCLSVNRLCYGNCTAADYWIEKGFNFGKKTFNTLNEDDFKASVGNLPSNQRWLRQGWASDCSFFEDSWALLARISDILAEQGIKLLIITKCYRIPSLSVQRTLAKNNAEIRVSLSAYDSDSQINQRLRFLDEYRKNGGYSVPYLMSAKFDNQQLNTNQEAIVNWIIKGDYIAGEHPLRLNKDNSGIVTLAKDGFWHPKFPSQYWHGRIFSHLPNLLLPPPTHLAPHYGLMFKYFSEIGNNIIDGLEGNLPTENQLRNGEIENMSNLFKHATYYVDQT